MIKINDIEIVRKNISIDMGKDPKLLSDLRGKQYLIEILRIKITTKKYLIKKFIKNLL